MASGRRTLLSLLILVAVATGACLRVVLWLVLHRDLGAGTVLGCILLGAPRDALTAAAMLVPVGAGLALLPCGWLARPAARAAFVAVLCAPLVFESLVEFHYFAEFDARFNNIAVDYVAFPTEVVGNVWESYDVPLHVAGALVAAAALGLLVTERLRAARFERLAWSARLRGAAGAVGLGALAVCGAWAFPRDIGNDRVANELAANGVAELVRAVWSDDLEYPLYYRTIDDGEARARAARRLGFPPPTTDRPLAFEKHFTPSTHARPPAQIVIVLEESLGSDFVGALGGMQPTRTPELERHFADGLVLSNLVANGNRTVRGLEGVLCSFVPLPGYAVLRRGKSEDVATIARVLRERGYRTVYFYGGNGTFDGMEPFLRANGWDELVTDPDYPDECFRTAWGVADEYVFDALLEQQTAAHDQGRKLFATMLTVSNHRPYDFPRGRYRVPADLKGRAAAVRYADACLGGYCEGLRARGLLEDTLVLVVGDHGARVYGAEEIPIESYRIPALFLTQDAHWRGQRIERLCSQIDLVPTLLDLAGIECTAPFLGESVLSTPERGGRAFVQHNRDVGMLTDDALVVLGLRKSLECYARDERADDALTRVDVQDCRELVDDATAVFQTAYELYEQRDFRLPDGPSLP